jgi:hypothetical protein
MRGNEVPDKGSIIEIKKTGSNLGQCTSIAKEQRMPIFQ